MSIKTDKMQERIIDYARAFAPTYFLTLQCDTNHRPRTNAAVEKVFYYFMSRAQRELLGRKWYLHHISFLGFVETNARGEYHIHILIKDSAHSRQCWENVLNKIIARAKRRPMPIPYLQEITPGAEWRVCKYAAKQLNAYLPNRIYADSAIISSEYLLGLKKRDKQWRGQIL